MIRKNRTQIVADARTIVQVAADVLRSANLGPARIPAIYRPVPSTFTDISNDVGGVKRHLSC
ncbi:MAG TPA: hypothetical protein VKE51_16045 [Vicinamibacterales bacterium]|nr:hypothetical protein [Vicinamibacterales bacterium]